MDVPTLVLLGAVGGALRGVLDFYIQFVNWRSARSAHRRLPPGEDSATPRVRDYFDPAVDVVAALVHSTIGAGLAVLFGRTGQISGPYAAIVVGISAPVILTQLSRVQAVSQAIGGGGGQDAAADPGDVATVLPVAPAWPPPAADPETRPGPAAAAADGSPSAPAAARVPPQPLPGAPPGPLRPDTEAARPQPNGRPAGPTDGAARGRGGHDASPRGRGGRGAVSRLRGGHDEPLDREPAVGEEGTP
ncbi:hypothetical protein [Streptomyces sp. NPDC052036]|uniref:hypothetical protein n=1 Tax=unclassified Streptomyces TaxID=2593676 RepID=UPI00344090FE